MRGLVCASLVYVCALDSSSLIISQEISGEIQVNSRLSGMPDLTLTFVDPSVLDDVRYASPSARITQQMSVLMCVRGEIRCCPSVFVRTAALTYE